MNPRADDAIPCFMWGTKAVKVKVVREWRGLDQPVVWTFALQDGSEIVLALEQARAVSAALVELEARQAGLFFPGSDEIDAAKKLMLEKEGA